MNPPSSHKLKKKQIKNIVKVGPPLTKHSGSAHGHLFNMLVQSQSDGSFQLPKQKFKQIRKMNTVLHSTIAIMDYVSFYNPPCQPSIQTQPLTGSHDEEPRPQVQVFPQLSP